MKHEYEHGMRTGTKFTYENPVTGKGAKGGGKGKKSKENPVTAKGKSKNSRENPVTGKSGGGKSEKMDYDGGGY